jgi:hypothetical protein
MRRLQTPTRRVFALAAAIWLFAAGGSTAPADDAAEKSTLPSSAQAYGEALLRDIDLNVALKHYEKVLTAKYDAELQFALGPDQGELNAEQRDEWAKRTDQQVSLLERRAVRLRHELLKAIEASNWRQPRQDQ